MIGDGSVFFFFLAGLERRQLCNRSIAFRFGTSEMNGMALPANPDHSCCT